MKGQKSRFVSFQTGVPWRSGHSLRVASWAHLGASSIPGVSDQLACANNSAVIKNIVLKKSTILNKIVLSENKLDDQIKYTKNNKSQRGLNFESNRLKNHRVWGFLG